MNPKNPDGSFEEWWRDTGSIFWARVNTEEEVKALCRIAYCQGKIDGADNLSQHLQDKLKLKTPPSLPGIARPFD